MVLVQDIHAQLRGFAGFAQVHQSQRDKDVEEDELEEQREQNLLGKQREGRHVGIVAIQILLDASDADVALQEVASAEEQKIADKGVEDRAHLVEEDARDGLSKEGEHEHEADRSCEQEGDLSVQVSAEEVQQGAEDVGQPGENHINEDHDQHQVEYQID